MNPVISFTSVKLAYGWLGNMAPFPIVYQNQVWLTSEALFQAMRYSDVEIKELIRAQKSPMAAKMKAKKHKNEMVIIPLSPEDVLNMKLCLKLKFDQHPAIKQKLLNTKEYLIVEDIGNRNGERHLFWGMKNDKGTWQGTNTMGKLLMELRDEYRALASL